MERKKFIEELTASERQQLFELHIGARNKAAKTYFFCTILGISVGILFCLAGFIMAVMGLSGSIEWVFESADIKSKLSNATPGVFFALMGMIIIWRYKPKIKDELEIVNNSLKSNQAH